MAQFDVYLTSDRLLVVDLQSSEFQPTNTRVVAPLILKIEYAKPISRANPELVVDSASYLLLTHFLSAIPVSELREKVASLNHHQYAIKSALDMLFYGF